MSEHIHPENTSSITLDQKIHDIGLDTYTPQELNNRYNLLSTQVEIGLNRKGEPTTEDGGVLAARTGISTIKPEIWDQVPAGTKAYVAEVGGTNWNVNTATKQPNGSILLQPNRHTEYPVQDRKMPYNTFIEEIATPIAAQVMGEVLHYGKTQGPVNIGISFGFPHINQTTERGVDAILANVPSEGDQKGELPKRWKITNWDPNTQGNITQDVEKKVKALTGVEPQTTVAINDTPAVALDSDAIKQATDQGYNVLQAGFVGGTGTNGALDKDGLVNLEYGHAQWPEDEVHKRMVETGTSNDTGPEQETGMYLPFRLAAGMELLHNSGHIAYPDDTLMQELTATSAEKDEALISHIADGTKQTTPQIQLFAQKVTERAGQSYGMMLATLARFAPGTESKETSTKPIAIPVEGGTLLKGHDIKKTAEQTAAELGQPLTIFPAQGNKGVAALAMSYSYLNK